MKNIFIRLWKDINKYKWIILGFLLYYFVSHHYWGAYCPMLLITGLPCPGCGMSRAIFFVVTFQFARAWAMNPVAFLWAALIFFAVVLHYILGKSVKKLQPILLAILFITIGYYLYRMVVVFPSYPPMVFRKNNVLDKFIPNYNQIIKYIFK